MQPPNSEKQPTKYDLCDDLAEIFAMLYTDPDGGPGDLRELLKANKCTREDLEDAALGLTDAGMHAAAKIVLSFAKVAASEDAGDICPFAEGTRDAKRWYADLPYKREQRRKWREEQRQRKRNGTWHVRRNKT
jgi:hypothetical protein